MSNTENERTEKVIARLHAELVEEYEGFLRTIAGHVGFDGDFDELPHAVLAFVNRNRD